MAVPAHLLFGGFPYSSDNLLMLQRARHDMQPHFSVCYDTSSYRSWSHGRYCASHTGH